MLPAVTDSASNSLTADFCGTITQDLSVTKDGADAGIQGVAALANSDTEISFTLTSTADLGDWIVSIDYAL